MNYIKHLSGFFKKVSTDFDLNPTHISLYIAIFYLWNKSGFKNPIPISRDQLMYISKIGSLATYHKCIKELNERQYVNYMPSYNQYQGSKLEVIPLETYTLPLPEKLVNKRKNRSNSKLCAEQISEQVPEQASEQALNSCCTSTELLPYINYLNLTNIENGSAQNNQELLGLSLAENESEPQKKLRKTKGTLLAETVPPHWELVVPYFAAQGHLEVEAHKFYNHFESNGWLVGGKSKMKDWKAAARNWMLNVAHFPSKTSLLQAKHLHTPNSKNYDEPL